MVEAMSAKPAGGWMWYRDAKDARLRAAAPTMLAALIEVQDLFEPKGNLPPDIEENFRQMVTRDPRLQAVRVAIYEALGDETDIAEVEQRSTVGVL